MNMYRLTTVIIFIVLLFCSYVVETSKILTIFPSAGYSQYFVGEPLLMHLAKRGHEVTLISFHTPKKSVENINVIKVDSLANLKGKKPVVILHI